MRPFPRTFAKIALWIVLSLPAAMMLHEWWAGEVLPMDLIEPSGDMAVRLMVLALLPGPLAEVFGPKRLLRSWLGIRRNLGVAGFCYTLLHLVFYAVDLGALSFMIDEIGLPGIWTGWLALALLIPAAATSMDRAMRALGRHWASLQRIVYAALILTFIHWLLLEWNWPQALVHAAPLFVAWSLRGTKRYLNRQRRLA